MSRFSDEYIQFCRNAALPRDFRQGDWVYYPDEHGVPDNPRPVGRQAGERYFANEWRVWLPQEGDLLDLLEAEGSYPALLVGLQPAKDGSGYGIDTAEGDDGDCLFGPDRKTGLLKLLVAVREDGVLGV